LLLLFILSNFWTIKLIKYYKEYAVDAVVEGNNKNFFLNMFSARSEKFLNKWTKLRKGNTRVSKNSDGKSLKCNTVKILQIIPEIMSLFLHCNLWALYRGLS